MENYKFDGILRNVLNDNMGYENFFDNIFGFLLRHTDFYDGLEKNQKVVLESAKKFTEKYKIKLKQRRKDELLKRNKEINEKKREEELKENKEVINEEKIEKEIKKPVKTNEKNQNGKLIPNEGNGSNFGSYSWTQTFTELNIIVPLKDNLIRAKNLDIEFTSKHILIKDLKNNKVLVDDDFYSEIKYRDEDINWIIDFDDNEDKVINISLEKFKQEKKLWTKLLVNEEELDEDKLEVKPMEVDELDKDTREEYMKMMYEKNEKNKEPKKSTLPKEENMKKVKDRKLFERFAEAHPEMDFSECKFN